MMSDSIPDALIEPQDSASVSGMEDPKELARDTEVDMEDQSDEENMVDSVVGCTTTSLPCRPVHTLLPAILDTDAESSEDDHGFTLVYRPRVQPANTFEEPMSSPEVIATPVFDMLAASGTPYPDDDDWETLE